MTAIENLADWRGRDVVDSDGEKVGRMADIYYDAETDVAQFVVVETGKRHKDLTLVPAGGITVTPEHVAVAVDGARIDGAPTVPENGELDRDGEVAAFEYYGYEYVAASTPSGRRLVRH